MRLGLNLGYWGSGGAAATQADDQVALAQAADQLGFAVVWAAEAYGSDAVTVLTWLAAKTQSVDVGSAVLQIPGRSPAMTAMTAATLDQLSGGRFRLGLGVSGPQVSEGWHGVRFDKPLQRTREYVDVVRLALERKVVRYEGAHVRLPLPDGPGKPLRLAFQPRRTSIPIYLAALGPRNLELTGEIADGWLGMFFSPQDSNEPLDRLRAGRAKVGKDLSDFDIAVTVPMVVGDDLEKCAGPIRSYAALYVGGMGSQRQNFYKAHMERMGYAQPAQEIQDAYLARDYDRAAAAVPFEFIDRTSLLGPPARIAERMAAFADAGATTLSLSLFDSTVSQQVQTLETAAAALTNSP
ncbi:MAG TPA: LLM class F420-dependent oxidoreductase [Actinomycetes bacterium]|nr:LLM class F420-dependent oxidoreductase [Actinomycetes bacterium]